MTKLFNIEESLIRLKFSKTKTGWAVLTACVLAALWLSLPKVLDGISFSRAVYDKNDQLLRLTLSGDEKYRVWTPLEEIHPSYQEAVLLLEDKYFYYHPGINPFSLAKAVVSAASADNSPGASTITMQLARIRYGLKTRTIKGKLVQIGRALQIELTHSKKQILEAYLNLVPFGGPVEGIGAASFIFFEKPPRDLTLSESLLLAVIPQSPSRRNLALGGTDINRSSSDARHRLLEKWLKAHPQDRKRITDVSLPVIAKKIKQLPFRAPHFTEFALRASGKNRIETTLDLNIQRRLEEKLKNYVTNKNSIGVRNAAALIVNHETQQIVAYVGSADFFNRDIEGQVDGIMAKRSPGSALKPFVYALGFQQGLLHSHTLLKDTPTQFAIYDPENFDQKFLGPLSAEQALVQSRNVPAINLSNRLSQPTFYEFLKMAHVHLPRDEGYYGLSLVLGGTEVSIWELAQLYSTLANRGVWSPNKWERNSVDEKSETLLTAESSFVILDSLTRSLRPQQNYRKDWVENYSPVAWKTGTSHGFRDAWTAGVAGPYTIVVWFGNFDNTPNPAFVGRDLAAPFFFQVADSLMDSSFRNPTWHSPVGLDLKKVSVCKISGHLPQPHCPHQTETWYQPGKSPIERCDIHRALLVSKISGLRSCGSPSEDNSLQVYEFWPSDLKRLFDMAGIHRLDPPGYDPSCSLAQTDGSGRAPTITSPADHVTYLKSLSAKKEMNTLSLAAVADGDAKELFWFVNRQFIGKSKSHEALTYVAEPGEHILSVVDDRGRSDHKKLSVQTVQ